MKLGADVSDEVLQERMDNQYVNKCCSLIYTVSFQCLCSLCLWFIVIIE